MYDGNIKCVFAINFESHKSEFRREGQSGGNYEDRAGGYFQKLNLNIRNVLCGMKSKRNEAIPIQR